MEPLTFLLLALLAIWTAILLWIQTLKRKNLVVSENKHFDLITFKQGRLIIQSQLSLPFWEVVAYYENSKP